MTSRRTATGGSPCSAGRHLRDVAPDLPHPGDLTTVLHGILATAAELTGGEAGSIILGWTVMRKWSASHGPPMQRYVGRHLPR